MKKDFDGRRQTLSAILPVLAAAVVLIGCGHQKSDPADATAISQESQTESETQQEAVSTETEEEQTTDSSTETEEEQTTDSSTDAEWIENIMLATDIHYFSDSLTDGGPRFQEMVEYGDGKIVTYIDQITDAFLDEVVKQHPDALVLSGDLTLNGEKASHKDLAEKLHRVENHGIPVLVIPGNHDINNHQAARYKGEERLPAEYTTPAEFRQIYRAFGYDEAASEDPNSLSYLYELDENTWLLMIDSCQYSPVNKVGGAISEATYEWVEQQLEAAWDAGVEIIPVAHHNLLDESEIYVDECTIEHSEQFIDLLETWDVPLFLSGHLHVQHCKRSEDNRGICELFHVIFQSFLIHLFIKIVFPSKFRQFFQRHRHYPFKGTVFLLKVRIDDRIIEAVDDPNQFHGVSAFCAGIDLIPECRQFFLQRLYASCKYITEYCNFQPV